MTLCTCVMAWAEMPEPQPFAFNEGIAPAAQKAPVRRAKAALEDQLIYLDYGSTHLEFHSLQAAFDALPKNSTPATVKLMTNIYAAYEGNCVKIKNKDQNVTLDLNGDTIFGSSTITGTNQVIENKGTLTIMDSSEDQDGLITNLSTGEDVKFGENLPKYAYNTILNYNTVILNSGNIENRSPQSAAYCIDNDHNLATPATFIMNGGSILRPNGTAIRMVTFSGNAENWNTMTMNSGTIDASSCAIWIHLPSGNGSYSGRSPKYNLTINGGEIKSGYFYSIYDYTFGDGTENVHININGGTIQGVLGLGSGFKRTGYYEKVSITGGVFVDYYGVIAFSSIPVNSIISGGWFFSNDEEIEDEYRLTNHIKPGYCGYSHEIEGEEDDYWTEVLPCNSQTVKEDKTMAEIVDEITTAGEEVSASIIVIDATEKTEHAVVTVSANDTIAVEGIVINTEEGKKEGQIVVESGAVLTVGNSGIVSENDELTTVVVKPGGTVIVGNGGVDQQGQATPVEIRSSATESGVFMVDPNAPAEVAQAPAKVKVYTRAHKDNGIEYWQQFASPVKGDVTITPLGVGQETGVYTSVYEWNYSNDAWERVEGMPVDLGGGVTAFDKAGWNGSNILTPFKAYNLINNSHLSEGGITYEFAGELVGNNDMTLNFPANGFCVFGNSYTAPIDLTTLFDQIENDMSLDNIDACVYIYNSTKDRFESVNALTLEMATLGFDEAPFTQIPPQQAFVMNLLNGGSAQTAVDYAKSVWGNPQTGNAAIMAPKRVNNTISAALIINVTDGVSTDRVVLVEDNKYSDAYDNGADAEKYMNNTFNIYANAERNLAMVATNDIEGTELTFAAGNAVNYTMTFGKTMGDFVLVDRANNNQVAIVEGGIYTFAAQPNATAEARFAIVPVAKMPTAIENTEVKANVKGIYTLTGQYMGEDFNVLPAGVYVVDGVKIVK